MEIARRGIVRDTQHAVREAPEMRFRIRAANAAPRRVRVIALGSDDAHARDCVAARAANVRFSHVSELAALLDSASLRSADECHARNVSSGAIAAWLGAPDLAIIVGREGDDAAVAVLAARSYRNRGVTVSAVIQASARTRRSPGARTADTLRPWCTMLVLASDAGYLPDLLDALGT